MTDLQGRVDAKAAELMECDPERFHPTRNMEQCLEFVAWSIGKVSCLTGDYPIRDPYKTTRECLVQVLRAMERDT